jgi:hypothetical protein
MFHGSAMRPFKTGEYFVVKRVPIKMERENMII